MCMQDRSECQVTHTHHTSTSFRHTALRKGGTIPQRVRSRWRMDSYHSEGTCKERVTRTSTTKPHLQHAVRTRVWVEMSELSTKDNHLSHNREWGCYSMRRTHQSWWKEPPVYPEPMMGSHCEALVYTPVVLCNCTDDVCKAHNANWPTHWCHVCMIVNCITH